MSQGWVSAHDLLNAVRQQETDDVRTRRDPADDSPWLVSMSGRGSTDSSWTAQAACSGMNSDRWYTDDVSQPAEGEPALPETAMLAIRICYNCPVRRRCLGEAFELTQPLGFGNLRVYTKHRKVCDEALYGKLGLAEQLKAKECEACVPEDERLREQAEGFTLKPMHAGIFGGIPAYIRKRLADRADRLELAEVWLQQLALKRHWTRNAEEKENVG